MANAKKSPAKKPAAKKPAARRKPAAKKAAAKRPAARKTAAKRPAAKKPAPRKSAPRKSTAKRAAAKSTARPSAGRAEATGAAGATAPRGGPSAANEALHRAQKKIKPQIAAAAEAIESTISDFIETADVKNFPDKLWRLLAMIAFAFVGYWVFIAVVILAAMQWVVVLLGDKPSPEIAHYMERCSAYVRQVLDLLSYRSETLPWPLGRLPDKGAGK